MSLTFKQLTVQYKTSEVPPPFSYKLRIICQLVKEELLIEFEQVYTHRDEVDEEEILAEGFTGKDDFQWQGRLPEIWKKRLQEESENLQLESNDSKIHLDLVTDEGKLSGQPYDQSKWEYLVQELTQAIFEQSQKEMPLQMGVLYINEQKQEKTQWLEFSFTQMKISDERGEYVMDWQPGRDLLQMIFMLDFDDPEVKKLNKPGYYLDPGDGYWYLLGRGARNPHPQNDVQSKIIERIKNFW